MTSLAKAIVFFGKAKASAYVVSICFLFLSLASLCSAATVADYRLRLTSAQTEIDSLSRSIADGADIESEMRQTIDSIKRTLPETESIEFAGTTFETANGWLRSKFEELERQPSPADRATILTSISQRLASIVVDLNELENAAPAIRSKDEDKQKLAEILSRVEYQKPEPKQESLFQRWLREFLEWLENLFPRPNISPNAGAGLQPLSVVLQFVIYGVIIALVGFLIYKFAPLVAHRFKRREKKTDESRVVLGEHIDATRSARDLFNEAHELARRGDLRSAIRKGYIALLCDLAEKKVIGLAKHKTNRDYLRDVRRTPARFEGVKRATGSFERYWYGFRQPAAKDWEEFLEQCGKAPERGPVPE